MLKKFICILALLNITHTYAQEYLYPVGKVQHNGKEKLCVQYQNGGNLDLWIWDPKTKVAIKGLLSSFTPAGLSVLPSKSGFSFVDNDRIRVKSLQKRSPRAVDFYGPYDMTRIHWIDDSEFYFNAKERSKHKLFHANVEGDLYRLTCDEEYEQMYPQKVEDALFYLEIDSDGNHKLVKREYPLQSILQYRKNITLKNIEHQLEQGYEYRGVPYADYCDTVNSKETIVDFGKKTMAFLYMPNKKEGFILEHPPKIFRKDLTLTFTYHHIHQDDYGTWHSDVLFTFSLPLYLLLSHHHHLRLYESIFPLLPHRVGDEVYFSHTTDSEYQIIDAYRYNIKTGETQQISFGTSEPSIIFRPFYDGKTLYIGGLVNNETDASFSPKIWINKNNQECFSFATLPTLSSQMLT